jgi:hypothetical protein
MQPHASTRAMAAAGGGIMAEPLNHIATTVTKEYRRNSFKYGSFRVTLKTFNMASPESSLGEEPKKNLEQITFRFCSEW